MMNCPCEQVKAGLDEQEQGEQRNRRGGVERRVVRGRAG